GMTQLADAQGRVHAGTVVQLGPCTVTQLKAQPTDGYDSVQVTWGKKKLTRVSAAERGHFQKANVAAGVKTAEFEKRGEGELVLGQSIAVSEVFKAGEQVDVQGVSKGRGYAGVIRRHHFAGFPGSHGTHEYFRHGGSIGNRSYPGRVRKGKKMAGHWGNEQVSIQNLEVVDIRPEENLMLVKGAVPGAKRGVVIVRSAVKRHRYR